jgi:hypothetical protein
MCGTNVETVDREGTSPHPGHGLEPSKQAVQAKVKLTAKNVPDKGKE